MDSQRRESNHAAPRLSKEFLEDDSTHVETKVERSFCENLKFFFSNVTVEPSVFLFFLGYSIMGTASANLYLQKACRVNLNFGDEICTAMREQTLESQNPYEQEVQKVSAVASQFKTIFTATLPCLLGLFIGPWSDKTGRRKIFLLLPTTGMILISLNSIIQSYFFEQFNLYYLIFTDAAIEALTGGLCVKLLIVYSFVSAITTTENRTLRLGLANASMTIGLPLGMSVSGIILTNLGYYGSYGISLVIHAINFLYICIVIKDPTRTSDHKKHDNQGCMYFCRTFFDLSNILDCIRVVFKDDGNKKRLRMILVVLVLIFLFGPVFGEMSVMYMFTRFVFNWNEINFALFQSYNFLAKTIGAIFSLVVFSKLLGWHDSVLGIISTVSKIAGSFAYCFAPTVTWFYIAPLIEILNATSILALRSMSSKLVAKDELGKLNSVLSLTEHIMPLFFLPLFMNFYTWTMNVLPGAVFLLAAALTFPALVFFVWMFAEHRIGLSKVSIVENGEKSSSK